MKLATRERMAIRVRIALASAVLIGLAGCSGRGSVEPPSTPTFPADPIKQMEIAFYGQPSPREIKPLLDDAMNATGTSITAENYSRAGSALVALRKQNGASEMDILRCMPSRADDPRGDGTFPQVAAVCSVDITQGQYALGGGSR